MSQRDVTPQQERRVVGPPAGHAQAAGLPGPAFRECVAVESLFEQQPALHTERRFEVRGR